MKRFLKTLIKREINNKKDNKNKEEKKEIVENENK